MTEDNMQNTLYRQIFDSIFAVGSSLARCRCEINHVLFTGGQVVFLLSYLFSPNLMSEIILTGCKSKFKNQQKTFCCVDMLW